jgi:hypothetical protein
MAITRTCRDSGASMSSQFVKGDSIMALLIVQAESEDTIAAPGNRQANYVCVSVTDSAGGPVSGLAAANFSVVPLIVGPGGALVNINSVSSGPAGTYIIRVVPIGTETWKAGFYIFAVAVTRAPDQGQALCKVKMD